MSERLTSVFIAAIYSMTVIALASLIDRRSLANDADKPALVSSIFLSNSGETFVAVTEVNNECSDASELYKYTNYVS